MNRRTLLAGCSGVVSVVSVGCLDRLSSDSTVEESNTDNDERLGRAEPATARLEPQEPYEIRDENGEVRVLLPDRDSRELSVGSWAEEIVVAEQVRDRLLDIVERELGVRPESGSVAGIQVDLMEPVEPPASSDALTAFDDPDESRLHCKVRHTTVEDDTGEPQVEPDVSYDTVVSSIPRSIDVTVAVDGAKDYFTRVPVVCSRNSFRPDE